MTISIISTTHNITIHIRHTYDEGQKSSAATCKDYLHVHQECFQWHASMRSMYRALVSPLPKIHSTRIASLHSPPSSCSTGVASFLLHAEQLLRGGRNVATLPGVIRRGDLQACCDARRKNLMG